jgi:hypothetical protein
MSGKLTSTSSVMEGRGAYNKHVKLPAGGAALALPLLEKAIQNMKLNLEGRPVVIGDYGSSQGKNSPAPMQFAIRNNTPRPRPVRRRMVQNNRNDVPRIGVARVKMLAIQRPPSNVTRRPTRSATTPCTAAPIRNPMSPLEMRRPACPGLRFHGCST